MKIRNEALCALKKAAEQASRERDLFWRFYESQFLHLLIPRETLTSLMVTSALAIKENFTIISQNRVLSYGSDILGNNQVLLWV